MPPRATWSRLLCIAGLLGSACQIPPPIEFNQPPVAGSVTIEPATPRTGDDLRAILTTDPADPDGDEITLT